jgi:hypothetical protein
MPTREEVFQALFAKVSDVVWSNSDSGHEIYTDRRFILKSRRVKLFHEVPATQQPSCMQTEHDENITQVTNMPYKQIWNADWLIYQCTGNDPKATPTIENNLIIDACFRALKPRIEAGVPWDPQSPRQTLGGLVYHCFINGEIFKDPGDIDKQGMIIIPITILVPN